MRAVVLYFVADLRAQGMLGTGLVRRGVLCCFAVLVALGAFTRARGELAAPAGPRPVFLAAVTLSLFCLLVANGLAAGRLSQTTGPGHLLSLRVFPLSSFGATAVVLLLTVTRALVFSVFFIAPVAAAGIAAAATPAGVAQAVIGFLVLPLFPAAVAGVLVRRAPVGASALLTLLAMVLIPAGNALADTDFDRDGSRIVQLLAIPLRCVLGAASGREVLTYLVVWTLVTVTVYGLLSLTGVPRPEEESTGVFPARGVLRRCLADRCPRIPTAMILLGATRVPLTAVVVAVAFAGAGGRLIVHGLTTAAQRTVEPAAAGSAVAAVVMAGVIAFAVTTLVATAQRPGPVERRFLAGLPLTRSSTSLATVVTAGSVTAVAGLVYLATWTGAVEPGDAAGVGAGWLLVGWLGGYLAALPMAVNPSVEALAQRMLNNLAGIGALVAHLVSGLAGGAVTGSAAGSAGSLLLVDLMVAVGGMLYIHRNDCKG